jgi:ABC-type antimicrobial peptide transport system permease subunit
LRILDHETLTEPDSYAIVPSSQGVDIIFTQPDRPVDMLFLSGSSGNIPLGLIVNASEDNPDGSGYTFKAGNQYFLTNTALRFANDIYWTNDIYISICQQRGLTALPFEMHNEIHDLLLNADLELGKNQYNNAFQLSIDAWSLSHQLYTEMRSTIADTISTVPFFALLLIPFTIILELLLFKSTGLRRILLYIGIYMAVLLFLWFFHPGFVLASNMAMIVLGYVTISLCIPILVVVFSTIRNVFRDIRVKTLGFHVAEVSRGSAALMAFSLGIENLKRHKLRTFLILITVILIIVGQTMFTSLSAISVSKPVTQPVPETGPLYNGIYIFKPPSGGESDWGDLSSELVNYAYATYGNDSTILPRSWLYWKSRGSSGSINRFELTLGNKNTTFYSFLGMTFNEEKIEAIRLSLKKGRWFIPTDSWCCILNEQQAEALGITNLPVEITLEGVHEFTVVGIVDAKIFRSIKDLNNEGITPLDTRISLQSSIHVDPGDVLIVQYENSLSLGATTKGISILNENSSKTSQRVINLPLILGNLMIYGSNNNSIYLYTYSRSYTFFGWQMQLIPFIICCLILLNVMVSNVQERSKEILIYSSIGVSPLSIAFMFLAESLTIAITGGVFGYVTGVSTCKFVSLYGFSIPLDYSSTWLMITLGLSMMVTILSTLYPAIMASRMITPSLERAWKVTKKPGETDWKIVLPFVINVENEVLGICIFLSEFFKNHFSELSEDFTIQKLTYDEGVRAGKKYKQLDMNMQLTPYERGIFQKVEFVIVEDSPGKWSVNLQLMKTEGEREVWITGCRPLIDGIRKQLLIWSSFQSEKRAKYIKRANELR